MRCNFGYLLQAFGRLTAAGFGFEIYFNIQWLRGGSELIAIF